MTREELRKKRQKIGQAKGYKEWQPSFKDRVEARVQNIMNNQNTNITSNKTANTRVEKVQNFRNTNNAYKDKGLFNSQPIQNNEDKKLKEKSFIQDLGNTASTAITSLGKTGKSSLYYMQEATLNNSDAYKELSKRNAVIKKKEQDNRSIINGKMSSDYKDYSNLKDPILDSLDKSIQKDEEKIQLNIDTTSNRALKKLNELVPSMTQSVVGMGASVINPALGIAFWQTSAGGDYIRQAKQEGMNNEQAFLYGTIMGSLESGTEWVGGKLTANVSKKIAKDGVISGLKAYGLDIGENFFEEAIMEPLQEVVKEATGGQANWNDIGNRMLRSGIDGALTSIIMGGVSAGVGKAKKLFSKMQNGEQITQQEIADTLKEINKSEEIDIENLLKQSFGFVTKNDMEIENTNRKLENVATQLSNEESANIILKKEKEQAKMLNNDISQTNQQVIPQEQNQAQNANMKQAEATQQINEKYNKFKQQLAENGLNYDDKRANVMFDLPNKRGIDVEVNSEVFKKADGSINSNINAMYITDAEGNRKIIYNPNANLDTVIEKNTIHEVVHDMEGSKEYKQLNKMVLDKMESTPEFQKAYNSLKEAYSKVTDSEGRILYNKDSADFDNMIKQEVVADYLGENLGNQEYINELVNGEKTRNIAQKIYDAIVSFLDKVTGYKSEEAYLRGLKDKFEKAFNSEYTNQGKKKKYSFAGIEAKTSNVNTLMEALKLEEKGKSAQEIFEQTGWYKGNEEKWRFEIADNDFNIKDNIIKKDGWYRLNKILDAPELFKAYPELEETAIYFDDLEESNGYSKTKTNEIYLNNELIKINDNIKDNELLGLKNQDKVFSTLMHEIQHLIQHKENFSKGSNPNYWYNKSKNEAENYAKTLPAYQELTTEKERQDFINEYVENIVDNLTTYSQYRNTAGEQEARNVQERIKLPKEIKKKTLPFVKNEETLYAPKDIDNYHISKNLKSDIDNILNNINERNPVKLREYTPSILVQNGIKDLPMYENPSHIRKNILTEAEAKKIGLTVNSKDHYHGLGKETYIKVIDSLDNPRVIFKNKNKINEYLILTVVKDSNNNNVIVPIEVETDTYVNNIKVDINRVKTVFGYDNKSPDLNDYIKYNIKNNKMEKIYEKKKPSTNIASQSASINSIPSSNENVNTTKYSMQESKNNTKNSKESSFNLPKNENVLVNTKGNKIDISNIKETSQMKLNTYNRKYDKNTITAYRGISENTGNNAAMYGLGLYTTLDKKYASKYGKVEVVDSSLLPDNPLKFKTQNDFQMWEQDLASQLGIRRSELLGSDYGIEKYVTKLGYDGLMIGTGKDTDLISFKNTDNINPTENPDIRYSQNDSEWQEFLDKNSINDGTRTALKEIKLPQKKELKLPQQKDVVEYRTEKNMKKYPEAVKMPIDNILQYKTDGGYRSEEQINNLYENIKKNGIKNPIELIRDEEGVIQINNGNHRLEVAQKIGLKEVPIIYKDYANIDNIDENMYDVSEKQLIKRMEAYNDRNNRNSGKTNIDNGRVWIEQKSGFSNRNEPKNTKATTGDDRISRGIQGYNDRPSSTTTSTQNNKEELDKSSSFNLETDKPTRHDVIQKNREIARENIKNIAKWKDKSNGAKYQLETMERNMYNIIPDKQEAKKVIDTYFTPVHESEAEKQRFINKYNDKIRELDLNKYEAEATQFLGELKYNPDFKITPELKNVLDRVNDNIQKGKVDKEKVAKSIDTFRNIYDELFEIENTTLRAQGYQEKPYRRGYFPHFIDYVEETRTEKVLSKLGFKIDKRSLPTDIAGITEQFVPGKTWNRSALQRKTNKTDFNALKGFDTYIAQAADNIFHTENIQKLRGLENEIRYQYSEKGIQERIDSILENQSLNPDEKQALVNQVFEQIENPMPNLVVELRRYTNALANKKSEADRSTEQTAGRAFYSTVNAIENRFAGNAVGLNIGSALTNFIPITQAYSQVGSVNMGRAMLDTMKSYIKDDGFVDKSAFLTSRLNSSDKLYKTTLEQVSEKANIAFDVVDSVASNIVVRGKYLENISNGMSETEAIKEADSFARSVMADRSKGALPTKFEEKNPLTKAFTQFQLEVNNQYRYMFKDIPRDLAEKGLASIALAYFKMFVSAWLYNKFSEEVTGRDQAFSPIDLVKSSYDTIQDEELSTYNKITSIATEVGEQLPFVGGLLGGGRVPVNGALPNIANVTKAGVGLATGEMNTKKALSTLGKEVTKPAYYLLPPFGGGQLKKTVEGIKTVVDGGSYGIDKEGNKNLQFPVEDKSATNYIKAGLFGKYALPRTKSYVEDGFKSLNAEQTEVYEKTNIDFDKLKEYFSYSKADNVKKNDKMEHISNMNTSVDNQWELYKYNIFSSSERDDGTSQVTDAEYAIKNKMATKKEYMKLYKEADKNNITFPNGERLKELKNSNLNLSTYMKYQTEVKKATNEKKKSMLPVSDDSKVLSNKEKINIIQSNDYTEHERRTIYANYIGKDDDTYNTLSKLKDGETNIDAYLDYKLQKFTADEDTSSNIIGKKVSKGTGSSKSKTLEYINNSSLSDIEKMYIIEIKYPDELNDSQKNYILDLTKRKITNEKQLEEELKKFKDIEQHKDGKWYWK